MLTIETKKVDGFFDVCLGHDAKFTINGNDVAPYISSLEISIHPHEIIYANVVCAVHASPIGATIKSYKLFHPDTGETLEVDEIKFKNGEVVKFNE